MQSKILKRFGFTGILLKQNRLHLNRNPSSIEQKAQFLHLCYPYREKTLWLALIHKWNLLGPFGPIYISWSHSRQTQVLWVARNKKRIFGVDVEQISRLHDRLINRISRPEERAKCDPIFLLWPIKEASFKAMAKKSRDIRTISQVQLVGAHEVECRGFYLFQTKFVELSGVALNCHGLAWIEGSEVYSIARLLDSE